MTERTDTWMPFLVQKYLADTMHLSTEQHGAYLLLLIHAWMNDGALPIDADKLRRISRMDRDAWSAQKDDVLAFFHEQDGMLRQKRLDIELARAKENVQQRSAAGKASAAKRAAQREGQRSGNEEPTTYATTVDSDVATGAPTNDQRDGQQTGIPIPTPVLLKKNVPRAPAQRSKQKPAQTLIPDDFGLSERVKDWATKKGFGQLEEHLESFKLKAASKGYLNVDWDATFMGAIRDDWAGLRSQDSRGNGNGADNYQGPLL